MDKHDPIKFSIPPQETINLEADEAFAMLYERLYGRLCTLSNLFTKNRQAAEDIVQDVFYSLWCRRYELHIDKSIESYTVRAVYNLSLRYLARKGRMTGLPEQIHAEYEASIEEITVNGLNDEELERIRLFNKAVDTLPQQCREIFILNKREGMRQKEIARIKGLSVKTVDNQIVKAVKKIREYIRERKKTK